MFNSRLFYIRTRHLTLKQRGLLIDLLIYQNEFGAFILIDEVEKIFNFINSQLKSKNHEDINIVINEFFNISDEGYCYCPLINEFFNLKS